MIYCALVASKTTPYDRVELEADYEAACLATTVREQTPQPLQMLQTAPYALTAFHGPVDWLHE